MDEDSYDLYTWEGSMKVAMVNGHETRRIFNVAI